jgi:type II secretory pathway component GspD/PulD (secretin)
MRVMAGEIARIFTGTQIPFSERLKVQGTRREFEVKYREVGVQLDILPTLVGQDEIEVVLVPSVSEVGGFTDSAVTGVSSPIIISRRAATKVRVGNRELITIGGLDQKRTLVSESKVPILGDIPLIKYLFRYKREIKKNIQVWFTVRPTIAGEAERIILPGLTGVR